MSDGLPESMEFGDTYALRTFAVKAGRLASVVQSQLGGDNHWENGVCEARCLTHPDDPDHQVPTLDCCGVFCYWTVAELFVQYSKWARHIVAVIRLEGLTIEGDKGVQANAAHIVACWCAEDDPQLARACAASAPGTRRYFDRDVMARIYGLNESPEERNHHG